MDDKTMVNVLKMAIQDEIKNDTPHDNPRRVFHKIKLRPTGNPK